MTDLNLAAQLISRLDTNQMALQAALEEVALWICQQGAEDTAKNITGALHTLNQNAEFIAQGIAELVVASSTSKWAKD